MEPEALMNEKALVGLVGAVADGNIGLHDERRLLVPRGQLVKSMEGQASLGSRRVDDLLAQGLLAPSERRPDGVALYHIVVCLEFVKPLDHMAAAGLPLPLQQAFSARYMPLVWALYSDIGDEYAEHEEELGRPLRDIDRAFVRVISDWSVAVLREQMEREVIERPDLATVQSLAEKFGGAAKRSAAYGMGEDALFDLLQTSWRAQVYRRQGIKEFVKVSGADWTSVENNLVWTGHFDFALCDSTSTVSMVIEYQGPGHFGDSEDSEYHALRRDSIKRSICEKAGVPLLEITEEYAYIPERQDALASFVRWHGARVRSLVEVENLLSKVLASLPATLPERAAARLKGIQVRQLVYAEAQQAGLMAALIWEAHELAGPDSRVPSLLHEST